MKNILVATDFSNNAYNALFHAVELVKENECTFHLLNVYDNYTPFQSRKPYKNLVQLLRQESERGLKEAYHRIKLDKPSSKYCFKTISIKGNLVMRISEIINKREIDLVVMGNSVSSEIEAIFLGSNVLRTIKDVKKCPVLTIPNEVDFKTPKQIAFVTDFKNEYDLTLLKTLRFIVQQFNSKVHIMHINENKALCETQHKNRAILLDYLSDVEYSLNCMPLSKSKATTIREFLNELNIDMLVMVNNEHHFFESISREPIVKRVAFNVDIPFLVIPN